jgi:hypothetical protein
LSAVSVEIHAANKHSALNALRIGNSLPRLRG